MRAPCPTPSEISFGGTRGAGEARGCPPTSPFSMFCHSPKGALQPMTQRSHLDSVRGLWELVCPFSRAKQKCCGKHGDRVLETESEEGREEGEWRLAVSCRESYALFMFVTSDFPFLVQCHVRVAEKIPQAPAETQTQTGAASARGPLAGPVCSACAFLSFPCGVRSSLCGRLLSIWLPTLSPALRAGPGTQ